MLIFVCFKCVGLVCVYGLFWLVAVLGYLLLLWAWLLVCGCLDLFVVVCD